MLTLEAWWLKKEPGGSRDQWSQIGILMRIRIQVMQIRNSLISNHCCRFFTFRKGGKGTFSLTVVVASILHTIHLSIVSSLNFPFAGWKVTSISARWNIFRFPIFPFSIQSILLEVGAGGSTIICSLNFSHTKNQFCTLVVPSRPFPEPVFVNLIMDPRNRFSALACQ